MLLNSQPEAREQATPHRRRQSLRQETMPVSHTGPQNVNSLRLLVRGLGAGRDATTRAEFTRCVLQRDDQSRNSRG